jgi:hypothetical protein
MTNRPDQVCMIKEFMEQDYANVHRDTNFTTGNV